MFLIDLGRITTIASQRIKIGKLTRSRAARIFTRIFKKGDVRMTRKRAIFQVKRRSQAETSIISTSTTNITSVRR